MTFLRMSIIYFENTHPSLPSLSLSPLMLVAFFFSNNPLSTFMSLETKQTNKKQQDFACDICLSLVYFI
jgi:hypothetical protein